MTRSHDDGAREAWKRGIDAENDRECAGDFLNDMAKDERITR